MCVGVFLLVYLLLFNCFTFCQKSDFSTIARTYGAVSGFHRNAFGQLKLQQQVGLTRTHVTWFVPVRVCVCEFVIST